MSREVKKRDNEREMKMKNLVERKREQDGKFALLLESETACQRDMRRELARQRRMEQVRQENAEFTAMTGIDPAEVFA